MPNTNAPFGFRQYRGLGSAPTYEQSVRLVSSANTTAIFFGDPVSNVFTRADFPLKHPSGGVIFKRV